MNLSQSAATLPQPAARDFLGAHAWENASVEPLTGDASPRRYFRLRRSGQTAVLMDASRDQASVRPYVQLNLHLAQLGFSAPGILGRDEENGLLLLEDFGDELFAGLLGNPHEAERLYELAVDVLVALHQSPQAIPKGLRAYHVEKMLEDIELFLEWRAPALPEEGRGEFRAVWREALLAAHRVPASLLLRDYHAANLMLLRNRTGVRQAGLLDFQDAYQGPVAYDLMSLLEDARRDIPDALRQKMLRRYRSGFPELDEAEFETSMAILAAQRHLRVLAIFERLSRRDGKHDYKRLHSPRVERLLHRALLHPMLAGVKRWLENYAWKD